MERGHIRLIFFLLTGLSIFLAFNRHSHSPKYTYHSELWADRAGYYVYLPAAINHGFNASAFPADIDSLTGAGFHFESNKIVTKYTYGVALLQLPFYLVSHGLGSLLDLDTSTFGKVDHATVNVAAPVYVFLGLYFLFLVLSRFHDKRVVLWVLFAIYLGSNLFYYTVADPGMSHAYSFFLFASFLLLFQRIHDGDHRIGMYIMTGLVMGSIVLIRPTNIIFIALAPLAYLSASRAGPGQILITRNMIITLISAVLIWVPQMIYWNHIHDAPVAWTYENEGFSNWNAPRLFEFWFSTNNGLIPYVPLMLFALWGISLQWMQGYRVPAISALMVLLLVSYIGGSWWVWHFGCGFGSRTMVEYFTLFAFPLATWFQWARLKWNIWVPIGIIILLAVLQLKMVYSYDGCWYDGIWDWAEYGYLIFGPTK